jgi:sugar phosphate isomerase/epimerase
MVLGIIVLILWFWYFRLYRATQVVLMSTAASSVGGQPHPDPDIPAAKPPEKPNIGVATGLFYERDVLEILAPIKEAGYDVVEIWAGPQKWGEYTHFNWQKEYRVHALSVCLKVLGLKVSSLHAPFSDTLDISNPNELRRQFAVNETLRSLEVLKYLGGEYLVVHPASNDSSLRDRDLHFKQSRKSLEEITLCLQDLGLKMAVENQLPHILGGDAQTLLALIDGLPPSQVGICFDTSHANMYYGQSVDTTYRALAHRVFTLHLSDNYGRADDHFVIGDGNVNWHALGDAFKEKNFNGVFMMEILAEANRSDKLSVLRIGYQRARELLTARLAKVG